MSTFEFESTDHGTVQVTIHHHIAAVAATFDDPAEPMEIKFTAISEWGDDVTDQFDDLEIEAEYADSVGFNLEPDYDDWG